MTGALSGIRALELAVYQNGPAAGYMLGDMGAEVIKIEDRVRGDYGRGTSSLWGISTEHKGINLFFETPNRNKKSITLDLKKKKGREILYKLVEKSDIFYTNFNNKICQNLGCDYETLRKINSKIIYGRASGYGRKGPESHLRAFDVVAQARSGMMEQTGEAVGPPSTVTGAVIDQMGATMLAYGILAALVARERQGIGQELETSLLGSAIHLQAMSVNQACLTGRAFSRHNRKRARNPLANYYQCADEKWIMFSELQSDRFWTDFCNAVGMPELITDPRFESSKVRRENFVECIEILDRLFKTKPRDEWMKLIREKGGGVVCSEVFSLPELPGQPQVMENEYIVEYDHPIFGKSNLIGFPVWFSETPAKVASRAPQFGEHTEEVLLELGGYSWEDIAAFREEEVI
jgi:crotonobetainyl-CoA:carnitine CoA-transferase CaiB-like acyl-CoA transferase